MVIALYKYLGNFLNINIKYYMLTIVFTRYAPFKFKSI